MSHELETFEDGSVAYVDSRNDAWHQLGTQLNRRFTAAEALQHAKLAGWRVRTVPLCTTTDVREDDGLLLPNGYAVVRTNPVTGKSETLGMVGSFFTPIQNEDHVELLNDLVDASGAHFETAGSLKGGRETFVTMELPETMLIGGVDEHKINIAALNSHDGNSNFRFLAGHTRIVCANTQRAAIAGARAMFTIRHTRQRSTMVEAREALGLSWKYLDAFQVEAEKMIQETMTDAAFRDLIDTVWVPDEKAGTRAQNAAEARITDLERLFQEAETQANIRGTRWAAYNAVTEYVDHVAPVSLSKNASDHATARALRTLTQDSAIAIKTRAFDLLAV